VAASPLLCDLIGYLENRDLTPGQRARGEGVLADQLSPVVMTAVDVRWPADDRARKVADGLAAAPADGRTLAEWGHEVGASERTLARAFLTGTGVSFGRWRTLIRVQSALRLLAAGDAVSAVARRVGYDSDSAFVQAFRRETGLTPGAYFRAG
jgi:AraC-like DNA-binding protein